MYSLFALLYPTGITGEVGCMFLAAQYLIGGVIMLLLLLFIIIIMMIIMNHFFLDFHTRGILCYVT